MICYYSRNTSDARCVGFHTQPFSSSPQIPVLGVLQLNSALTPSDLGGVGEGRHNMSVQNFSLWRLERFSEFLCWEPRTETRYHNKRCSCHSGNYLGLTSFVPETRTKTKYLFLHLLQYHSSTVSGREDLGNIRWDSSVLTSYSNVKVLQARFSQEDEY